MKSLFDLLQNYKPPEKSLNPRASLIKEFIDEINNERPTTYVNKKGVQITLGKIETKEEVANIAIMLSVLKTNDEIHRFLAECRDFKRVNGSFSKRFFGGFKKQKWKRK